MGDWSDTISAIALRFLEGSALDSVFVRLWHGSMPLKLHIRWRVLPAEAADGSAHPAHLHIRRPVARSAGVTVSGRLIPWLPARCCT
jgi:hypothetical protein